MRHEIDFTSLKITHLKDGVDFSFVIKIDGAPSGGHAVISYWAMYREPGSWHVPHVVVNALGKESEDDLTMIAVLNSNLARWAALNKELIASNKNTWMSANKEALRELLSFTE